MIPRVIDAKYIGGYTLYLRFSDGSDGEVDLEHELDGEIFEPLKDISYFKDFTVTKNFIRLCGLMALTSPQNSYSRE